MSRQWGISALPLCALLAVGCATVVNTTNQRIAFDSNPKGAAVFIGGERKGVTPVTLDVKRGSSNRDVMMEMYGYEVVETQLVSRSSSWPWVDVAICFTGIGIIPGALGLLVDCGNGSAFYYEPESVRMDLVPKRLDPPSPTTPHPSPPPQPTPPEDGEDWLHTRSPETRKLYEELRKQYREGGMSMAEFNDRVKRMKEGR